MTCPCVVISVTPLFWFRGKLLVKTCKIKFKSKLESNFCFCGKLIIYEKGVCVYVCVCVCVCVEGDGYNLQSSLILSSSYIQILNFYWTGSISK